MHMSYENEISKFYEGRRGEVLANIIAETNMIDDNGEFIWIVTLIS